MTGEGEMKIEDGRQKTEVGLPAGALAEAGGQKTKYGRA
jgi:hypothetical protein